MNTAQIDRPKIRPKPKPMFHDILTLEPNTPGKEIAATIYMSDDMIVGLKPVNEGAEGPKPVVALEIVRFIDGGHYGEVYEVLVEGCVFALKVDRKLLKPSKIDTSHVYREYAIYRDLGEGEDADMYPQNPRHFRDRFIVKMYGLLCISRDGADIYAVGILMNLYMGSLGNLIRKSVTQGQVVSIGKQLAMACTFIHRRGYVHCDLKPGNIMQNTYRGETTIRIGDLGSMLAETDLNRRHIVTSAAYAAPELFEWKESLKKKTDAWIPLTRSIDAWSCGIILYELATQENLLCVKPGEDDDYSAIFDFYRRLLHGYDEALGWEAPTDDPSMVMMNPLEQKIRHPLLLDLIKSLLHRDPVLRADDLNFSFHRFFAESPVNDAPIKAPVGSSRLIAMYLRIAPPELTAKIATQQI